MAPVSLRVIYGDTDQMGVVYYANYLRYFEAARAAFLRDGGLPYADVERQGLQLPVVEAHVRYLRPARYDDLLEVTATPAELRHASLRFTYQVRRADELLAEGFTVHACVNAAGRPTRLPAALRRLLDA